ncbi:34-kDa subunit of RNA polymerase III (C) [Spathaspora passalidarum NRRL Y-27907]|uniref:DNA-directed RNA polymerase III subunit RPC6 n=1 Tax=Spathaspora passalidarum (strain NRRL Y-27907 / 11-Y1) TaxID=619300 RepID=G3AUC5_SPAPN|nr:34-kDa subunit of RNA polymerase III (C) [Spathaspora passalidarum NRRL Y-27907]EGW30501.1 34-kDa subunit of RNA polymerase III (C) [Spathaspora passalidarum NRRL Y-27907]
MSVQLSEKALLLHGKMSESPTSTLFNQQELQDLVHITKPVELLSIAQELINSKLVKLVKQGEELKFQAVSVTEASKITQMTDEEAMVYSYIEASGREGIWTKTIKARTNLHQHVVAKCLKSLEGQRYIKSIKSVKHPTRKIYMLYNLQPSIEITGGPWFTDSELDTEFIDSLVTVIWRFAASKTFPSAFQQPTNNVNPIQATYPATHTGFVDLDQIMEFISVNKITNIELGLNDIRSLCDVLIFDDKLELVSHTTDTYKATWQSVIEAGFGRGYLEQGSGVSEATRKAVVTSFSIFDHYQTVEETEDLAYLDSWTHQ